MSNKVKRVIEQVINVEITPKEGAIELVDDGITAVRKKAAQAKREYDLRRFKPIMEERLPRHLVIMPDMIQITDYDKREDEEVCKGAVAFNDGYKGISAITILTKNVDLLNSTFYPTIEEGVYYRDPYDPHYYINLNDYFEFLKKAKVHELNQIAQALGAKHIKITLMAEKKYFVQKKNNVSIEAKKVGKGSSQTSNSVTKFESIEVAAEKSFKGHEPHMPELKYFENEPDIHTLIKSRLDKDNPIIKDRATFKYNTSSLIKRNNALKIEGMLKKFKISGNATISKEVENEERIFFDYEIEYPEE